MALLRQRAAQARAGARTGAARARPCQRVPAEVCLLLVVSSRAPARTYAHHYRRLGGTQLRDRLLEAEGFTVVPLPFYEWEALGSDAERGAYLQHLVDGAVAGEQR